MLAGCPWGRWGEKEEGGRPSSEGPWGRGSRREAMRRSPGCLSVRDAPTLHTSPSREVGVRPAPPRERGAVVLANGETEARLTKDLTVRKGQSRDGKAAPASLTLLAKSLGSDGGGSILRATHLPAAMGQVTHSA